MAHRKFIDALGPVSATRLRRLRRHDWSRRLVAESSLTVDDLIWPLFVHEGRQAAAGRFDARRRAAVESICWSRRLAPRSNSAFPPSPCFPSPIRRKRRPTPRKRRIRDNLVCRAVRAVKAAHGDAIGVICDVALDPYTSHGQDGLVRDGYVVNDETIDVLCRQAVVQAAAGCDVIAPSDMMDGRVGAIRRALDEAGFDRVSILAYAAKYASAFYGPFRDAVGSAANLGERRQADLSDGPGQLRRSAPRSRARPRRRGRHGDGQTGHAVSRRRPPREGHVSSADVRLPGERRIRDARRPPRPTAGSTATKAILESLLAFKRAGADGILTYFAPEAARLLRGCRTSHIQSTRCS